MWRQGASALFRRVTDASPWVLGAFGATALATLAVQESNSLSEPVFTASEVAEHSDLEKGVWVTYDGNVFDVTPFVLRHPGGPSKLMMAAGGSLEPFWQLYQQHTTQDVQELLKSYRIGKLDEKDAAEAARIMAHSDDPYAHEPRRHPALKVLKEKPFNAEAPLSILSSYITPESLWYVRHHHPVPTIDPEEFRLDLCVNRSEDDEDLSGPSQDDERTIKLSLDDLKTKYKRVSVTATMQCGGNRRSELNDVGKTQGLKWQFGAISTATWTGVPLRDLLKTQLNIHDAAQAEAMGIFHVQFAAADDPFDSSIPISKAMDPRGDVLLAYEVNGHPIGREHGGPLRAIVPGYIGTRNVKWLSKVVCAKEEAYSTWQRGVPYKMYNSSIKSFDVPEADPTKAASVMEMPVTSAIVEPEDHTRISPKDGKVTVKGYAYSGGGRNITRVDVSADGGKSWTMAKLLEGKDQPLGRAWAWTQYEADVAVPKQGAVELLCRAVDSSANQQPESRETVWNLRGILNNSWHRITVNID